MTALLPCPFCGGSDGRFLTDAGSSNRIGKWGWWECDCGARAEDVRTGYNATGWQDDAIAAWNRRAPSADARELQETFDLQWKADMRAVEMWRKANPGNDLVLPDRANLVVWQLDEIAQLRADARAAEAAMRERAADALQKLQDQWQAKVDEHVNRADWATSQNYASRRDGAALAIIAIRALPLTGDEP